MDVVLFTDGRKGWWVDRWSFLLFFLFLRQRILFQMAGRVGGLTGGLPHKEKLNNVRALTSEEARWVFKHC